MQPRVTPPPGARRSPPPTADAYWLYGRHAVIAALGNPERRIDRLLAVGDAQAVLAAASARTAACRPPIEPADRRQIEALIPPDVAHQGVAARVRRLAARDLADVVQTLRDDPQALLVVLDQVTDPRNVGAVLRSAEAFGAAAVIVQQRHAPEEGGALAKAASGALERVPLLRTVNLARALRTMQASGFRCIGLAAEAEPPLDQVDLAGRTVLVLGAEGAGLRRLLRETCDQLARIPIAPLVESLNLSAAAAVALYACAATRTPHVRNTRVGERTSP